MRSALYEQDRYFGYQNDGKDVRVPVVPGSLRDMRTMAPVKSGVLVLFNPAILRYPSEQLSGISSGDC